MGLGPVCRRLEDGRKRILNEILGPNASKSYQILNADPDFVTFTQHRFLKTLPDAAKTDFSVERQIGMRMVTTASGFGPR